VDGLPTLVVTHQLQVERRTGKVRRPQTDVLPLCHATNSTNASVVLMTVFMVPSQRTAAVSLSVGCYRPHPPSPFISIIQPES